MAFVNEPISDEDYALFDLEAVDARPRAGHPHPRNWTIDRERNVYLRYAGRHREEGFGVTRWELYWKGALIELKLIQISSAGERGGHVEEVRELSEINIPPELESHREQIIDDLRDALQAYKDGGIRSTATSYQHTLLL